MNDKQLLSFLLRELLLRGIISRNVSGGLVINLGQDKISNFEEAVNYGKHG